MQSARQDPQRAHIKLRFRRSTARCGVIHTTQDQKLRQVRHPHTCTVSQISEVTSRDLKILMDRMHGQFIHNEHVRCARAVDAHAARAVKMPHQTRHTQSLEDRAVHPKRVGLLDLGLHKERRLYSSGSMSSSACSLVRCQQIPL